MVLLPKQKHEEIDKVYAAIGGSKAILDENFMDLKQVDDERLKLLLQTPASAIGTSRYELEKSDYEQMVEVFKRNNSSMFWSTAAWFDGYLRKNLQGMRRWG